MQQSFGYTFNGDVKVSTGILRHDKRSELSNLVKGSIFK